MTRESWLNSLTDKLRPLFQGAGFPLPDAVHVSCGWPTNRALAANSSKSRTLGQCFSRACSDRQHNELFITPAISDGNHVAAILVHELCHAALDCEGGHGPQFRKVATAMGLIGKMTATSAGHELEQRLNALLSVMAKYPHATVDVELTRKKAGTRLIKIACADCGWTARTTEKWIEDGLPTCQCGGEFERADSQPRTGKRPKPSKPLHKVLTDPPPKKKRGRPPGKKAEPAARKTPGRKPGRKRKLK